MAFYQQQVPPTDTSKGAQKTITPRFTTTGDIVRKPSLQAPGAAAGAGAGAAQTCQQQHAACMQRCEELRTAPQERGGLAERRYQVCVQRCDAQFDRCKETEAVTGEDEETAAGCPPESEQNEGPHEGCPCGSRFPVPSESFACPSGYKLVMGSAGPSCRCIKWCNDMGLGEACIGKGGATTGLGEYQWPAELTSLYNRLMGRAGEYLGRKPGYSQSAIEAAYGKGYENIRNLERAKRIQAEANLQREGMLGTGAGQAALRQLPWQTERNVSDVVRDLFLSQEEQKRKDLESYTGIAQSLFGTGVGFKQVLEAINAARRGEGQNALALWMQYITNLMGSWAR